MDIKTLRRELKSQWKSLWYDKIDDKKRAEGIASKDYSLLFVEKGTVIVTSRDHRPLNFRDIQEGLFRNLGVPPEPHFSMGGVGKFIRDHITSKHTYG